MTTIEAGSFDAVIFDAGGVFVLPDPTVIAPLLAPFGGSIDLELHRRAHYAGMAAKSRVDAVEADWQVYNETYVATIGVAADMATIAATLLGRTRSADLWRYPIEENVNAIGELADTASRCRWCRMRQARSNGCLSGLESVSVGRAHVAMRTIIDSEVVGIAKRPTDL